MRAETGRICPAMAATFCPLRAILDSTRTETCAPGRFGSAGSGDRQAPMASFGFTTVTPPGQPWSARRNQLML